MRSEGVVLVLGKRAFCKKGALAKDAYLQPPLVTVHEKTFVQACLGWENPVQGKPWRTSKMITGTF